MLFYGALFGVSEQIIAVRAAKVLRDVGLDQFADREAASYSYGNRRKLSLAISMLGRRQLLCLDERVTHFPDQNGISLCHFYSL
jgi:ABC-type multidrug transport system ATPase subunit